MLGLRSAAALRRAALAATTGAGVALVGVSFANIASLDGTLRAAVPPPAIQERAVSDAPGSARDCPVPRSQAPRTALDPAPQQY